MVDVPNQDIGGEQVKNEATLCGRLQGEVALYIRDSFKDLRRPR